MRKNFTKMLVLALILTLGLPSTFIAQVQSNEMIREMFIAQYGLERFLNHERAVHNLDRILDSFPMDRMGNVLFPSYYGGSYIDDNGNLNMLVVENFNIAVLRANFDLYVMGLETILEMENTEYGLIVKPAEFSFNDLRATMFYIFDFLQENPEYEVSRNTTSFFLDVPKNRIVVNLVEFNYEQISRFRNEILDTPMIVFGDCIGASLSISEYVVYDYTWDDTLEVEAYALEGRNLNFPTLHPGNAVYVRFGNEFLRRSIGYRVSMGGTGGTTHGFITAAHCTRSPGGRLARGASIYNSDRQRIGTVESVQLPFIDAAFVRFVPSIPLTPATISTTPRCVRNGITFTPLRPITRPSQSLRVGEAVMSVGAVSGASRLSFIRNSLHSDILNGERVFFTVVATSIVAGDSGGIVFCSRTLDTVGINIASINTGPYRGYSAVSLAHYINLDFGLSVW